MHKGKSTFSPFISRVDIQFVYDNYSQNNNSNNKQVNQLNSTLFQVSSFRTRTVRVGILESMIFMGGTIGPLLGGWVQEAGGRPATFTVIMACHAAIVIYIILCVRNIPPRCVFYPVCFMYAGPFLIRRSLISCINTTARKKVPKFLVVPLAVHVQTVQISESYC